MKLTDGNKGRLKPNLVRPLKIEIRESKWGYGVFATEFIENGEIIEEAVIFADNISPKLKAMKNYRFKGYNPKTHGYCYKIVGGALSLVNQSTDNSNCLVSQNEEWERVAYLKATKDIQPGEELLWTYGAIKDRI